MVDVSPPQKNDEQYPLLQVESGGGDSQTPTPTVTPGWNVTSSSKRSWLDRWPEVVSACWMCGMLLGLFFLILYGMGLGVVRRQPILVVTCNNSRSAASDVYFHHIVRGRQLKINEFSKYLSHLASLYPFLRFNVIFLLDDFYNGYRRPRLFSKLIPYHYTSYKIDDVDEKEIFEFNSKYPNVNITITHLSTYMAMTPLKYKWRGIPDKSLIFYLRVISVWQNGGIGMDLVKFKNKFFHSLKVDRRIEAIMEQHNNGINSDEYKKALGKNYQDEQNEFMSMFYGLFDQILNQTKSFFDLAFSQNLTEKDAKISKTSESTHREKRELSENSIKNLSQQISVDEGYTKLPTMPSINIVDTVYQNIIENVKPVKNITQPAIKEIDNLLHKQESRGNDYKPINKSQVTTKFSNGNVSVPHKPVVLYDISILTDVLGPPYMLTNPLMQLSYPEMHKEHAKPKDDFPPFFLSINADGSFIAASWKQHPFLAHIISNGCRRAPPEFAIQDAIFTQCSNVFKEDVYCSNVYILK